MTIGAPLRPGDKIPFCYGMSRDGAYWSFEDQAGRPAALIFVAEGPIAAASDLIASFAAKADAFDALGAEVVVLASAHAPDAARADVPGGVRLILCPDLPAPEHPCVLVADRALRLAAGADGREPQAALAEVLAALAALPREPGAELGCPAPILVTPGVLDADACARLIARFEAGDHQEGAMASVDGGDGLVNRIDAAKKHRRDLVLEPEEPLHAEVMSAIAGRVIPEIAKAFQAEIAYVDRILIARYDETGGYFKRHRDNSSPHVAFREFALSLNLNTGAYAGGGLLFPEFNDHRHQPPAGSACVFSASLLHEATPVTKGSRYVLLTFLHGERAEAKRVAGLTAAAANGGRVA
jgi:predicted 2-oxoglutarate/Fe(II)-dependent dioxygenase YbiX